MDEEGATVVVKEEVEEFQLEAFHDQQPDGEADAGRGEEEEGGEERNEPQQLGTERLEVKQEDLLLPDDATQGAAAPLPAFYDVKPEHEGVAAAATEWGDDAEGGARKHKKEKKDKKDKKEKKEKKEKKHKDKDKDRKRQRDGADGGLPGALRVKREEDGEDELKVALDRFGQLLGDDGTAAATGQATGDAGEASAANEDATNEQRFVAMMRASRPNRRGKQEVDRRHIEEVCRRFVDQLEDADIEDKEAVKRGEPALSKLKLLKQLRVVCAKRQNQEYLIRHQILSAFEKWLRPGKRGDRLILPNLDIRTTVLHCLGLFPLENDVSRVNDSKDMDWEGVTQEDLTPTKLGSFVKILADSEEETAENRRSAQTLVERWSRLIFGITCNYKLLENEENRFGRRSEAVVTNEEQPDLIATLPVAPEEREAMDKRYQRRVRRPVRQVMDFLYRPKAEFSHEQLEGLKKAEPPSEPLRRILRDNRSGRGAR